MALDAQQQEENLVTLINKELDVSDSLGIAKHVISLLGNGDGNDLEEVTIGDEKNIVTMLLLEYFESDLTDALGIDGEELIDTLMRQD